jgi:hypothetical protein
MLAGGNVGVSFYEGDPRLGGRRLGTANTVALLAVGEHEEVTLTLPSSMTTSEGVFVVADDRGGLRGTVSETDEENNFYDSGIALTAEAGTVDLTVARVDAASATADARTLVLSGTLKAEIRSLADGPVTTAFTTTFFEDVNGNGAFDTGGDAILGAATRDGLGATATAVVEAPASGSLRFAGSPIYAFVDSGNVVVEASEANNVARAGSACSFVPTPGVFAPKVERATTTWTRIQTPGTWSWLRSSRTSAAALWAPRTVSRTSSM